MVSGSANCAGMTAGRKERTFTEGLGRTGAGVGHVEGGLNLL